MNDKFQYNIFAISIVFYECYVNKTMYQCPEDVLLNISTNKELFPAKMRGIATYWRNERYGRHKPPSTAQLKARDINWSLHQLGGMKGTIGGIINTLVKYDMDINLRVAALNLQSNVNYLISKLRTHNFTLTGKPSKQEQKWLDLLRTEKEIS